MTENIDINVLKECLERYKNTRPHENTYSVISKRLQISERDFSRLLSNLDLITRKPYYKLEKIYKNKEMLK